MSRFQSETGIWSWPGLAQALRTSAHELAELRPVAGAQIVAQDYLNINTVSQLGRRLKFRPGEKCLIQACGHPFRLGPVVANCSINPELTKIIDGRYTIILPDRASTGC